MRHCILERTALYQKPDKDPRLARDLVGTCSSKVEARCRHSCLAETGLERQGAVHGETLPCLVWDSP